MVNENEEKERYARLCWLVSDAGCHALRATFDCFYSPMNVKKNLNRLEKRNIIAKLQWQGRITKAQQEIIYPSGKLPVLSRDFSFDLLLVLLQNICHISDPYPYGWNKEPLLGDKSLSADITRLKVAKDRLCRVFSDTIGESEFKDIWELTTGAIYRLAGTEGKRKICRIESEIISTEFMQNQFIKQLRKKDLQTEKTQDEPQEKLLKQRSSASPFKDTPPLQSSGTGIPQEDVILLGKTFKLLIDSIQAEDTLEFLEMNAVIDKIQRQKVTSIHKNAPRMRYLINIIQKSTNPQAFKLFCESIKEKYTQVYGSIFKARDQIYQQGMANKTDIIGYCRGIIIKQYKKLYGQITPLLWEEWTEPREKFYVPLQLFNCQGQELSIEKCFPKRSAIRVMYGQSGSGKTTLCGMLAKTWAQSPESFSTEFDLVLYLDTAQGQGKNITEMIYSQILPEDFRVNRSKFQSALMTHAEKILFIMDGFTDGSSNPEVEEILQRTLFPGCTVLLMADPTCTTINKFHVDSFTYCQGLPETSVAYCIKTYTNLVNIEDKPLNKFFANLQVNKPAIQTLRIPLLCTCMAAYTEEFLPCLNKLSNTASALDNFFELLLMQFCNNNALIVGGKPQPNLKPSLRQLKEQAYKHLLRNCLVISTEEIEAFELEPLIPKLGIFVQVNKTWTYQSRLWRDYLAAAHLSEMEEREFTKELLSHKLLKLPQYQQCTELLSGKLASSENQEMLNKIFTEFASHNRRHLRGISFLDSSNEKESRISEKSIGQFNDFVPSLSALYETKFNTVTPMCQMVRGSMPSHMVMKSHHVFPEKALLGLSGVLRSDTQSLVELEIGFAKLHEHQTYSLLQLAQSLGQNQHVRVLRVTWSSLTIAARFLGSVLENNTSLRRVFVDRGRGRYQLPSRECAALWAGIQTASSNTGHLESFSFLNCPYPAVVGHLLRHLSPTLAELNISGSEFDLVCGHRLAAILEHTTTLTSLDISEVQIGNTEFAALVQGLKVCPSLQVLKIAKMKLGRLAFLSLCDSLTLTKGLENLDLSGCQLTSEMGTRLAQITGQVTSLKLLNLLNTEISHEGRSLIQLSSPRSLKVVGIQETNGLPPIIGGE